MPEIYYLSLKRNLDEIREFYTDMTSIRKMLEDKNGKFLKCKIKELEQCFIFLLSEKWIEGEK